MLTILYRAGLPILCGLALWLVFSWPGAVPLQAQGQEPAAVLKAVEGGGDHTCVLMEDGIVKCWGGNREGQLGDGTRNDSWVAVDVRGLEVVQAISAGWSQTCALTTAGSVLCWGHDSQAPVAVPGLGSGVKAIEVGYNHACAITGEDRVKCWGDNSFGQLGDGTTEHRAEPVNVVGLQNIQALTIGGIHTCAATVGGAVKCWGVNYYGQLGDGTTTSRLTPVDVVGLESGVQTLAAGENHTCAVTSSGVVQCWGDNRYGQFGNREVDGYLTPVEISNLPSSVKSIVAGSAHTCALIEVTGDVDTVNCWGQNWSGQLGDGAVGEFQPPVQVADLGGSVVAIGTGAYHTCAVLAEGGLKCWGSNWNGQLGSGFTYRQLLPVPAGDLGRGVHSLVAGDSYSCALVAENEAAGGEIRCWGKNTEGELGDGTYTNRYQPAIVRGLGNDMQAVSAGRNHACALSIGGIVECWGYNWWGQLGDGTLELRREPVEVIGLGSGVQALAAGRGHTCAVTGGGGVKCWGDNAGGQLGDGTLAPSATPVDVAGLDSGVRAVAAGLGLTCALLDGGGVKCWGATRLGDGTRELRRSPVDVKGLRSGVQAITAGDWHACALTQIGGVQCWGENRYGQLGNGSTQEGLIPVDVAGLQSGVQAIDAGGDYTCAVTTEGDIQCWGWSQSAMYAALRDPTFQVTPVRIGAVVGRAQKVATGGGHVCVLAKSKGVSATVQCWGNNFYGELGRNPGWAPLDVLALLPRTLFAPVVRQ